MSAFRPARILAALTLIGCVETRDSSVKPVRGFVPDQQTAIQIAEAVWAPIYGKRMLQDEGPFRAVLRGRVWHVYGDLPRERRGWMTYGGVLEADIDRYTGKILRVDHGE